MFKKLTLTLAAMLMLMTAAFAQAPTPEPDEPEYKKNEISIQFEAVRQKVEARFPGQQDFVWNPNTDSVGGSIEYVRKVTPILGIGMRAGVQAGGEDRTGQTFSCGVNCTRTINSESQVALAYFEYLMRLQSSKGKFKPYIEGTVGISRNHFTGFSLAGGNATVTGGNSYTAGAGAGFDIKLSKNVDWRFGADYLNTKGLEGRRHNLLLHTGPVIRFGR